MAALFFLVIVGLFGILSLRIINMGTISSSEEYLFNQGAYSALGARDLRVLYLLSNGATGWDGTGSIRIGPCTVTQAGYSESGDKDLYGNNITVIRFRLQALCGAEGQPIGRTWEAVVKR